MAAVSIDQATRRYGDTAAMDDVCLEIGAGELVTLLGPSGCGKSTTLRAVAGLVDIDSGSIRIGGTDVTRMPIHKRNLGMVFQNLALFPHMSVAENIGFGLRMRGLPKAAQAPAIERALGLVRLPGYGARYPHQLSGGQQQRIAIARALVIDPAVLLLDEPFAALDRKLREEMQVELRELTRRVGITALFVTHDQEEALTLSDRIAVMHAGRVEQVGPPAEIYERPETRFVADFMGVRNILEATVGRSAPASCRWPREALIWWPRCRRSCGCGRGERRCGAPARGAWLLPATAGEGVPAEVTAAVYQGAFVTCTLRLEGTGIILTARRGAPERAEHGEVAAGDTVRLAWRPVDVILLRSLPAANAACRPHPEGEAHEHRCRHRQGHRPGLCGDQADRRAPGGDHHRAEPAPRGDRGSARPARFRRRPVRFPRGHAGDDGGGGEMTDWSRASLTDTAAAIRTGQVKSVTWPRPASTATPASAAP